MEIGRHKRTGVGADVEDLESSRMRGGDAGSAAVVNRSGAGPQKIKSRIATLPSVRKEPHLQNTSTLQMFGFFLHHTILHFSVGTS